MKDKLLSLAAFLIMVLGPFAKTYMIGGFSSELQLEYIKIFFILQFLIPICNFGLVWEFTRKFIETEEEHPFYLPIASVVICAITALFSPVFASIIFLAICHSCWSYFLQIRRLVGNKYLFMFSRVAKVILDVSFLSIVLACGPSPTIFMIIVIEIAAVLMVIAYLIVWRGLRILINISALAGVNRHLVFALTRVTEANYMRLGFPFLFPDEKFVQVFFVLVGYEYVCQFANLNFIRNFLNDQDALRNLILFIVLSLPLQIAAIYLISFIYSWQFDMFAYLTILMMGNTMILLLLFVRVVRKGDADSYLILIAFNVFIGLLFMWAAWAMSVTGAALYLVLVIPKIFEVGLLVRRLINYEAK